MTDQKQVVDTAGASEDSAAHTVSREELLKAIHRRDAALERARTAEEQLTQFEAAKAEREKAEKEAAGRFQELAQEADARASAFESELLAARQRLERLSNKQRASVMTRLQSLPEDTRQHLTERFGEDPDVDALDDAVSLAESLRTQANVSAPRNIGAQPSAGRVPSVNNAGKATPQEIAKMSQAQMQEYLKRNYGR